jgi:ornithine carbamoyltransferase
VADARDLAQQTGAVIEIMNDPNQAVDGADAVYTDAWTSMGHEHEEQQRNQIFPPYQVNEKLVAGAAPHAVFMHCLPAHRNMEITDAIMDSDRSVVFDQAESRLHVQKAIMLLLLGGKVGRTNSRNANG